MERIFGGDAASMPAVSGRESTADGGGVICEARDRLRRQLRLRLAVLVDAIACLEGGGGRRRDVGKARREAVRWLRSREQHPFSFVSVCEALGIDPAQARATLLADHLLPECRRFARGRTLGRLPGKTVPRKPRVYLRAAWGAVASSRIGGRGRAA